MTDSATLRAAAAIVEAAADRKGHAHWKRIAAQLNALADRMAPEKPPEEGGESDEWRESGPSSQPFSAR